MILLIFIYFISEDRKRLDNVIIVIINQHLRCVYGFIFFLFIYLFLTWYAHMPQHFIENFQLIRLLRVEIEWGRVGAGVYIYIHICQCINKQSLCSHSPPSFFSLCTCLYPSLLSLGIQNITHTDMEDTKSRFKRICVFCGSSSGKKPSYQEAAVELGKELVMTPISYQLYIQLHFPLFLFSLLFPSLYTYNNSSFFLWGSQQIPFKSMTTYAVIKSGHINFFFLSVNEIGYVLCICRENLELIL